MASGITFEIMRNSAEYNNNKDGFCIISSTTTTSVLAR